MKITKLKLNKFRVAKLTGTQHIMGGEVPTSTETTGTETTAAQNPNCILTSREIIDPEPDPLPGGGNG